MRFRELILGLALIGVAVPLVFVLFYVGLISLVEEVAAGVIAVMIVTGVSLVYHSRKSETIPESITTETSNVPLPTSNPLTYDFFNPLYVEIGEINRTFQTGRRLPYMQYPTAAWTATKQDAKCRLMEPDLKNRLSKFYDTLGEISDSSRQLIRIADEALLKSTRKEFGKDVVRYDWRVFGFTDGLSQGSFSFQPVEAVINGLDAAELIKRDYNPVEQYQIQIGLQIRGSNEVRYRDTTMDIMKRIFSEAIKETSQNETMEKARDAVNWIKQEGPQLHDDLGKVLERALKP